MAEGVTWEPHLRMSFGGSIGTPAVEEWSNTVRWNVEEIVPTEATLQAACDALVLPLQNWIRRTDSKISATAALTWVKLNWIEATGLQRAGNTVQSDVPAPNVGNVAGNPPPFYQTFAITLRTRLRRGRSHAGRVYPPLVHHDPDDAGSPYTGALYAQGMATSFIQLLRESRTAMGAAFEIQSPGTLIPDPAVFSPGVADKGTVPLWEPIISAVVDRVPDVQHRRTRQVPRVEGGTVLLDP